MDPGCLDLLNETRPKVTKYFQAMLVTAMKGENAIGYHTGLMSCFADLHALCLNDIVLDQRSRLVCPNTCGYGNPWDTLALTAAVKVALSLSITWT